eukprot:7173089-Prymnesium_polylepis.1
MQGGGEVQAGPSGTATPACVLLFFGEQQRQPNRRQADGLRSKEEDIGARALEIVHGELERRRRVPLRRAPSRT